MCSVKVWVGQYVRGHGSDLNDGEVLVEADEVCGIPGLEPGAERVSCRGDQQIHDSTPGLAAAIDHRGSQTAVADGHAIVHGQRIEVPLQDTGCGWNEPSRSR